MVDKIEMSLDDIIKTNKIGFRRGGGAGAKKQVNGAGAKNRNGRNAGGNSKAPSKFRGTTNRQIGGKPKGRSFGGAPTRKFTRVRMSSDDEERRIKSVTKR